MDTLNFTHSLLYISYHPSSINRKQFKKRKELSSKKLLALLIILTIFIATTILSGLSQLADNIIIGNSGTIIAISPLHIEGKYVKDIFGNTIVLRGINKHGFEDQSTGVWQRPDSSITTAWEPETIKANLDAIKTWGINLLRIHTAINLWKYDVDGFRQKIKDLLTWAGERGIYVIYDCYSVVDYFSEGHQADPLPYPPYNSRPDVIGSEREFVEFWVSIANELKDYPNVLFELWNEPHIKEGYTWEEMREGWKNVTQWCINAIRATGAENIIVASWSWGIWVNLDYPWESPPSPVRNPAAALDWIVIFNLSDPLGNILYDTHLYRGDFHRSEPEYVNSWTYEDIKSGLHYCWVDYVLNNLSKPIIFGEIGPNMAQTGIELERELAFYNNSLTIFNELGINYAGFWWWQLGQYAHLTGEPNYQPNRAGEVLIKSLQD